jgi:hypothetical protein
MYLLKIVYGSVFATAYIARVTLFYICEGEETEGI